MEAKDLRIGNLIMVADSYIEMVTPKIILEIYQVKMAKEVMDKYQPIELTKDWLVKMGFEKLLPNIEQVKNKEVEVKDLRTVIIFKNGSFVYNTHQEQWWINNKTCDAPLKYVHQLQNLYWCLCGKELTIKQ